MEYNEFCREINFILTERMAFVFQHLPELYETYRDSDPDLKDCLFKAFCGSVYSENKKKQLRVCDYREMLPDDRYPLFDRLCSMRFEISKEENIPAYIILHNRAIYEICRLLPETEEALAKVPHIGEKKVEKYGDEILYEVRYFLTNQVQ